MGTHKGHNFTNPKTRASHERKNRRGERQYLAGIKKTYGRQPPKPKNTAPQQVSGEPVLPQPAVKKRKKSRSGGTKAGYAFRPKELWEWASDKTKAARTTILGTAGSGDLDGAEVAGQAGEGAPGDGSHEDLQQGGSGDGAVPDSDETPA